MKIIWKPLLSSLFCLYIISSKYLFLKIFKNKNDSGLKEWLKKLIISLHDFEIDFVYNISVKNFKLDSLTLDLNSKYIYS